MAHKEIVVRDAVASDSMNILEITREAFAKYAFDLGLTDRVQALRDDEQSILEDMENMRVYIAYLEGEPVGTIRYATMGDVAFISRFGVFLKAQSCGVGRALIQKVFEQARKDGLRAVALHTSSQMASLIRFYYGQGFYIRCTNTDRGYVRALLVRELVPGYSIDTKVFAP